MSCSVLNCKKRSNKTTDLRFFTFPKDEAVAQEWLKYCKPITNIKRARICSIHFLPSDYNKTLRQILLNPQRSRALKPDAIPSLHLNLPNHDQLQAETRTRDAMVSETGPNWYSPSTQSVHWSTPYEESHQWETRLEVNIKEEDTKIEMTGVNTQQEQQQDCPTSATTNVQYHTVEDYQTQNIPIDLPQNNQPNQINTLYKETQNKQTAKDKRIRNLKKLVRRLRNTITSLKTRVEEMDKNKCECQNVSKNDKIRDDSLNLKAETENGKMEI